MNFLFYILLVLGLHLTDAVLTVLIIRKAKIYFDEAYEFEVNYHKYFFKRFGEIKGGLISFSISSTVIFFIGYYSYHHFIMVAYMIIGMLLVPVYSNWINYFTFDSHVGYLFKNRKV